MKHNALMHHDSDDVAVVIEDVAAGTEVSVVTLEGEAKMTLTAAQDIPLGHKIALRDVPAGQTVTKYGRSIGKASQAIEKGQHVHTQNVKSVRWA